MDFQCTNSVKTESVFIAIAIGRAGALLKMFFLLNWLFLAGLIKLYAKVPK